MHTSPDLCVVTPAYNEEANLPVLVRELTEIPEGRILDEVKPGPVAIVAETIGASEPAGRGE